MVRGYKPVTSSVSYSLQEIKNCIHNLKKHKIQWNVNDDDGRKRTKFVAGTIIDTYKYLFAIKIKGSNRIECFSYTDLYSKNIKILSRIDGKDILKRISR